MKFDNSREKKKKIMKISDLVISRYSSNPYAPQPAFFAFDSRALLKLYVCFLLRVIMDGADLMKAKFTSLS